MTLFLLTLAQQQTEFPQIKPYQVTHLSHSKKHDPIRARIFLAPKSRTAICVHDDNQVTVLDTKTGSVKVVYALNHPYGDSVHYVHPRLISFPKYYLGKWNQSVAFSLNIQSGQYSQIQSNLTYQSLYRTHPEIYRLFPQIVDGYQVSNKSVITRDKQKTPPYDTILSYRVAPEFKAIKQITIKDSSLRTYLTPDRKQFIFQSNNPHSLVYSVPGLKKLGVLRHSCGELVFDPHSKWAVNSGFQVFYHTGYGGEPILMNLATFKHYRITGDNSKQWHGQDGIECAAVDSSLGIAVTIRKGRVEFFHLPKN
jgi:hypothetical protein